MTDCNIINGNSLDVLKTLDAESVQCCVTSPPYFGLRDYGHTDQIGLEATPQAYVAKMVEVFSEVRRVLKNDGTLWLNLGDTYAAHKDCKSIGQTLAKNTSRENAHVIAKGQSHSRNSRMLKANGFKNKDLIGIPWRVAFALQEAGWWLRQDIIWHKPNPMPESVTDRCTKSHEYIFLLTKSAKYYYNADAIKEPSTEKNWESRLDRKSIKSVPTAQNNGIRSRSGNKTKTWGNNESVDRSNGNGEVEIHRGIPWEGSTRNKRSVWTVTTKPYKEAHFATFPPKLIEPCILAGSREGDTILDPFNGAGTTGLVALENRRKYIGIELNPDYIAITKNRLKNTQSRLPQGACV